MAMEDLLLEQLRKLNAGQDDIRASQEQLKKQVSDIDQRLRKVELTQENTIMDTLKLILENQSLLIETTAKKEDVEALREELGIQKFKLQAVTERLHTDAG